MKVATLRNNHKHLCSKNKGTMTKAQKLKGGAPGCWNSEFSGGAEPMSLGGRQDEADSVSVGKIADWIQLLFQK